MAVRPLTDLAALSGPEFMEVVRGRSSANRGAPFDEFETELWRWGWSIALQERAEKEGRTQCH